ncbi:MULTISPECIES: GNAT family N-acetyltransferase [unclassified Pseudomonas]|uniref:GNAT family N-acetyltransferase n=1 Tax=unclassified Pseudomonas TaxID=196821 RepID=UPI00209C7347|nr:MULTISPECIES: GNAT family N-acetyltransferase [unclassified Pseudomonas]MCP1446497.1 RimJ/RimL family protein N-acetyltransferase [Pseudomonas sp. GGS8]WLG48863.1 GNAT family N-acetyltransferase [Pseudomonas sp. FP1742]
MKWQSQISEHLENEHVLLRPVLESDKEAVYALAQDSEIWTYFVFKVSNLDEFDDFFNAMLSDHAAGRRVVYVVIDKKTQRIAGSMSYGNLAEAEARLEIGWSWLGSEFRGKGINHWAKFLLMEQAFEKLEALRVEFKTDILNTRARSGLRNIGATEEGTLRSFNFMPGGRRRDAIFYSVLASEWPDVNAQLSQQSKFSATRKVL